VTRNLPAAPRNDRSHGGQIAHPTNPRLVVGDLPAIHPAAPAWWADCPPYSPKSPHAPPPAHALVAPRRPGGEAEPDAALPRAAADQEARLLHFGELVVPVPVT